MKKFFKYCITMLAFFPVYSLAAEQLIVVDNSELPVAVNYKIANEYKADSCEFYIDGFGDGTESAYHGVGGSLYESWIKTSINYSSNNITSILNAGGYFKYMEQSNANPQPVVREALIMSTPISTVDGVYRLDFRYKWHNFDYDYTRTLYNFAFFIDAQHADLTVSRIWLTNGPRDFTIASVFDGFPLTTWINVGPGSRSVRYIENFSRSPLFDQRRVCKPL